MVINFISCKTGLLIHRPFKLKILHDKGNFLMLNDCQWIELPQVDEFIEKIMNNKSIFVQSCRE